MTTDNDLRLIEAGFPCHQVGAETQRERGASSALPPLYFLHVWWARRPLTPSRAAISASLLPADADTEEFLKGLGIVKKQVGIEGVGWTLPPKLLHRTEIKDSNETIIADGVFLRALAQENAARVEERNTLWKLGKQDHRSANQAEFRRWLGELDELQKPKDGEELQITIVAGDPEWGKTKLALAKEYGFRFPRDAYEYGRAYQQADKQLSQAFTVLDPTAGGGSIPFEALRLGHQVIANELNPVATTILHATLEYPAKFGKLLGQDIQLWGTKLLDSLQSIEHVYANGQELFKEAAVSDLSEDERTLFRQEQIVDYLYCRQVTCPHCGGEAPLLNSSWLSKSGEQWGVAVDTHRDKTVSFRPYRVAKGQGPNGEDPNAATVTRGVGQCVHCKQAIDGDEIKAQARGDSAHGRWQDRLYTVVAVRLQPKLDKHGRVQRYQSGANKGEIKTEKVRYFRAPNDADLKALAAAEQELKNRWEDWELEGLIPTERFPKGNDMRPVTYGMERWCDMFTPRQLLGHLILTETLNKLKPEILSELGLERGRAVVTYLQFAIDKGLNYNSVQARWHYGRGVVVCTFGRHDFSLKWTFSELVFGGPNSGAAWGLSQVLDAYRGIAELAENRENDEIQPNGIRVVNGSATNMDGVADQSVDLICMDPPYYDNVQYAELSDFFYVWQKRTLSDLYPGYFERRVTDKSSEAVANPARDGKDAKRIYQNLMQDIFTECARVLKDDGVMTIMFTHKKQEAWETLSRSLIESGWNITSSFPVDSESAVGIHAKDKAAAISSIFISCRKRVNQSTFPATWRGFGGQGVQSKIERAVREGLIQFEGLKLNPVDRMVASYGRALKVLSENWPVLDGDEEVSPTRAMAEASRVVAEQEIERISKGRVRVEDLDSESALAVMALGLWGHQPFAYDDALNLTRSLKVTLESKSGGYRTDQGVVGIAADGRNTQRDADGHFAPLAKKGSKLRLLSVNERSPRRLENPQTAWDKLQGMILNHREGGIVQARNYLTQHAENDRRAVLGLLEVYAAEVGDAPLRDEAEAIAFELRGGDYEVAA